MTDQEILEACLSLESKDEIRAAVEEIFQKYSTAKDYAKKFHPHSILSGVSSSVPLVLGYAILDEIDRQASDLAMIRALIAWSKHVHEYAGLLDTRRKADYTYAITLADKNIKEFKHAMTSTLSNAYHNKPTGE